MKKNFAFGLFAVLVLLATAAVADPPSRVARLQYISGDVSLQPGGVNDWVAAVVNRPLTTADRVWTDKDSRSELQLGGAFVRMGAETSLTLSNVSDDTVQLQLDQGTLNVRIQRLYAGQVYEVDTPNLAFTVTRAGAYRFDVDPNSDRTRITVWRGEGEATGEGRAVEIRKNEQVQFMGGTSLQHQALDEPEPDGFDDWCNVRDRRIDESASARYVSADVIGYEDLDGYGTWHSVPDYGPMWVPTVASGWAPYRYGHWVWIEPWGWTWVDDAPWGFAPSHYGRWVYYRGAWGWVPGPVRVRPVYAPALVAWVGGTHWGVSMTFGGSSGVAWFPLGYGEPYIPPYHVTRNYFQQVNVTNTKIVNITNVTNNYYVANNNTTVVNNVNVNKIVYRNQNVDGAVTAVPRTVLVNSQSVGRVAVRVPQREIASVPAAVAAPVAPTTVSVLGNAGHGAMPPSHAVPRAVFTRVTPPERPVPFAMKQQALSANPGRPLDDQTEQNLRRSVHREPLNVHEVNHAPVTPAANTANNANTPVVVQQPGSRQEPNSNRPLAGGPGRFVPRPPQAGGPQPGNREMPGAAQRPAQPIDGARGMPQTADQGMRSSAPDQGDQSRRMMNRPVPRPPVQSQPLSAPGVASQPQQQMEVRPPQNVKVPAREMGSQRSVEPAVQPSRPQDATRPQQPARAPEVQRPQESNTPRVERTVESQPPRAVERPVYRSNDNHSSDNPRPNVQPVREQRPTPSSAPAPAPEARHDSAPQQRTQEVRRDAPARQSNASQNHRQEDHSNQQR